MSVALVVHRVGLPAAPMYATPEPRTAHTWLEWPAPTWVPSVVLPSTVLRLCWRSPGRRWLASIFLPPSDCATAPAPNASPSLTATASAVDCANRNGAVSLLL